MSLWNTIEQQISAASGQPFALSDQSSIGGGCISSAYRIAGEDGRQFFVKTNSPDGEEMFAAEAEGLAAIAASDSITVPAPLAWGVADGHAYLVMEYLPLGGRGNAAELGRALAQMHRHTQAQFGWHRDNTIGATPQPNSPSHDWIAFWREQRLGFQLQLAADKGYGGSLQRKGEQLLERFPALFSDYLPKPSLLHGDLWSGNYDFTRDGRPVIFDPAVYFGDREADIAMTELFGGFPANFYAAYNEVCPLDSGYSVRKVFYNLYHILNHLNLFGGGYGFQAERMMGQLLDEL